ncbi:DNA-directed DNA polymerase [Abeliophyllum distichum]|uniref:DNA-directed DNA polymerase n=1 Tax=Abeliophyllum distichum TaxID=126358 RepID=A0ABD1RU37_9LAMI
MQLEASPSVSYKRTRLFEPLGESPQRPVPFIENAPDLELKPLPSHLRYAYLGNSTNLPVIIANDMTELEEEKLLRILRNTRQPLDRPLLIFEALVLLWVCIKLL